MAGLLIRNRQELTSIFAAYTKRQFKEGEQYLTKISELIGNPVDGEQTKALEAFCDLIVEPLIDFLLEDTSLEEFIDKTVDIAIEVVKTLHKSEIEAKGISENEMRRVFRRTTSKALIWVALQGEIHPRAIINFVNMGIHLARKKGVFVEEMFRDDGLFKELMCTYYTPESFRRIAEQSCGVLLDEDFLFDELVETIEVSENMTDKEIAEMKDKFKRKLKANPEIQTQINQMRDLADQVTEETIQKYFR